MGSKKHSCQICDDLYLDNELTRIRGKNICPNCMKQIWETQILFTKQSKEEGFFTSKSITLIPTVLKSRLDEYVIGQEHAKKVLSVAVYNHYKRISLNNPNIRKSNILMIGPTGCGKTHIIKTLASILDIPVAIAVATTLTEEGYIGEDVSSVIEKLYFAAGKNIERAENGIVFIDEIDKLAQSSDEHKRLVGKSGVQQSLLAMLEGTKVSIGGEEIDTSNILFICGGAFPKLEEIVINRLSTSPSQILDSLSSRNDIMLKVINADLLEFGLIPEFIGRLPVIVPFTSVTVEVLKKILEDPVDSIISEFQQLFKYDDIKLTFENDALDAIAKKAYEIGTGARSLRNILEGLLLELMYSTPANNRYLKEIIVTRNYVNGVGEADYKLRRYA